MASPGNLSLQGTKNLQIDGVSSSNSVTVDRAGNVYVAGMAIRLPNGGDPEPGDAFVAKYSKGGSLLWKQVLSTAGLDNALGIAVDPLGNVYVSGTTDGALGSAPVGGRDAFIVKYDTGGTLLWKKQLGTSALDSAFGIALDGKGNAYIAGVTFGDIGAKNAGASDAWVAKYDPEGNLRWIKQWGSAGADSATAVAIAPNGDALIAGQTEGSVGSAGINNKNALLARYNPRGELLWVEQISTPSTDGALGIVTDAAGNALVVGGTEGQLGSEQYGGEDAFVALYDSKGHLQWNKQLGTQLTDVANSVAIDQKGNVFIAGMTYGAFRGEQPDGKKPSGWVAKLNLGGSMLWLQQFADAPSRYLNGIAIDSDQNLRIAGSTFPIDGDEPQSAFLSSYAQSDSTVQPDTAQGTSFQSLEELSNELTRNLLPRVSQSLSIDTIGGLPQPLFVCTGSQFNCGTYDCTTIHGCSNIFGCMSYSGLCYGCILY